jgi:amino acid adenylation domain-containing protein
MKLLFAFSGQASAGATSPRALADAVSGRGHVVRVASAPGAIGAEARAFAPDFVVVAPERGDPSLLAAALEALPTRVVCLTRDATGLEALGSRCAAIAPLAACFEGASVAPFEKLLSEAEVAARVAALAPEARALLLRKLQRKAGPPKQAGITRVPRDGNLPLAFQQERLWFIDQLYPGKATYNIPAALRMRGQLDAASLERAMKKLVERHESLRTTIRDLDGQPRQVIHDESMFGWALVDLSADPPEQREERLRRQVTAEAFAPFDLDRGPLVRAKLFRLGPQEHALVLVMHHIVSDGWSIGVLVRELVMLYQGFASGAEVSLPALPIQYADYAAWQRRWLTDEVVTKQLSFWREQLEGAPPAIELPTDRPRPAVESFRGDTFGFELDADAVSALRALGQSTDATLFMLLLAAYAATLARFSGQDDVVIGTPVANRGRSEVEGLIGFFANTIPVRVRLKDDPSFADLLGQVRETAIAAYAHQEVPFEKVVADLHIERDLSRAPVFQVLLSVNSAPRSALALPGLEIAPLDLASAVAHFDLTLIANEAEGGALECALEYSTDLFDRSTVARFAEHLRAILEAAPRDPARSLSALAGDDGRGSPRRASKPVTRPNPRRARAARSQVARPPRSDVEKKLHEIWCEVLRAPAVDVEESFFDVGGHSLLATQVVSRVRKAFGVDLPLRAVFEHPTIARLAAHIEDGAARASSQPPLVRAPRDEPPPLSFAQERLWIIDQLDPGSSTYNLPGAVRLVGELDPAALSRAIDVIVERHEVLRTTFEVVGGEPRQRIHAPSSVPVRNVDLRALPERERAERARDEARAEGSRPFDLGRGPLIRVALVRLTDEEHLLLFTMHHAVSDGWSIGVLVRELSTLYAAFARGEPSPLAPLPIQYADFSVWQRGWLQGAVLDEQLAYWAGQLEGAPNAIELPIDHPRPAVQTFRGATVDFRLDPGLRSSVLALAHTCGATPFMTCLTAFAVVLSRYARQNDVVIGTPVANRTRRETEALIGFFVNTLALRVRLEGATTFRRALEGVRDTALGAYSHQDLPFEKLVDRLQPPRDLSRSPVFQVFFSYQSATERQARAADLRIEPFEGSIGEVAKFELSLYLTEEDEGLSCMLEYNTDLFDRETVEQMAACFQVLLRAALSTPDEPVAALPMLTQPEEQRLIREWNATEVAYPAGVTIPRLLEEQAAKTPDAVALVFEDVALGYRELQSRANRLSHFLLSRGIERESIVAVFMERSIEMIVALHGVMKAGAVYLPIDPGLPPERVQYMLEDSGARVVLMQAHLRSRLGASALVVAVVDEDLTRGLPDAAPRLDLEPTSGAYLIYTSGSTGRPKGALNTHAGLYNRLRWMQDTFRIDERDAVLQKTSFSFDVSVWELFWPFITGARLVVARPEGHKDPAYLADVIQEHGVTTIHFVPSMLEAFVQEPKASRCTSLRRVICSGEALPRELARRFFSRVPGELHNLYGPTEAAIDVSWWRCKEDDDDRSVPIGRPIANTQLYVLDPQMRPVPVGVAGELFIGGVQLARGYWRRPELTAERFVASPFGEGRLYRTGDLARWRRDGAIEYLGRLDHQVKLRGFRIELGEIEAALRAQPGIRDAVVLVREDVPGDKRIVAYVVGDAKEDALRESLRARLPDYMVPSAFVVLGQLPVTSNGKVDRRALPAPERKVQEHVEPRTETERKVAGIFAEVLGVERVGALTDFFELGGHSLLATQVMSRVRDTFELELPLRVVFEHSTVEGLSKQIDRGGRRRLPPLRSIERGGASVLSYAQERLWFLQQLEPDSDAYNVPSTMRMRGRVDDAALERALREILRRHEVLRTTYQTLGGRGHAVVQPVPERVLAIVAAQGLSPEEREERIRVAANAQKRRAFDLSKEIPVRAELLRFAPDDRALLLTVHHIASDGVSQAIIARDFGAIYSAYARGEQPSLPEPEHQYEDYATWQREVVGGGLADEQLSYWKEALDGAPSTIALPVDGQAPATGEMKGGRLSFAVDQATVDALERLAKRKGATLFMSLAAALEILVQRYASQDDFVIATLSANRTPKETEKMVGFFVNTLLLRARLGGDPTVADVVTGAREAVLGAQSHADVPFQRVLDELRVTQEGSRPPFLQVLLGYIDEPEAPAPFGDMTVELDFPTGGPAVFDLQVSFTRTARGLDGIFYYSADLFEAQTIERLRTHFVRLLEEMPRSAGKRLSEIDLLSAAERRRILEDWSGCVRPYDGPRTLHGLVAEQARRTPEAIAVVQGAERVSYRELDERAGRLAAALRARGVRNESLVGLCVERSIGMVVGVLGIMKAGGAYVPLDPKYPQERLRWMLEDAQPSVVVTDRPVAQRHPELLGDRAPLHVEEASLEGQPLAAGAEVGPGNAAYVIYTSGSTGKPKGVAVEHGGACNLVRALHEAYDIRPDSHVLQFASLSFDAAVEEIFKTLTVGACLHLTDRGEIPIGAELDRLMKERGITNATFPPSVLAGLNAEAHEGLRTLVTAGESCPSEVAARWSRRCRLVNAYGPTEATVCATYAEMRADRSARNIGKPLPNKRAYVLGKRLEPVPVGVAGELYLGGAGVARGYLGRPDLTAERFVPDPYGSQPGARLYKTGDLARWLPDGTLEFLGRADEQIKIRGFRVEPGEVESALLKEGGFAQAIVVKREDRAGDARLVAYVAPPKPPEEIERVRAKLREQLPEHMVPSAVVALEALPLGPTGKVDVKKLPAPDRATATSKGYVAPSTPVEKELAQIWREVLGVERVGVHDDFFELGGHSLLLTQVVARVHQAFLVELPLRAVFDSPTLEGMVAAIGEKQLESLGASGDEMLDEISNLSPEEVAALLAAEGEGNGDDR